MDSVATDAAATTTTTAASADAACCRYDRRCVDTFHAALTWMYATHSILHEREKKKERWEREGVYVWKRSSFFLYTKLT